MLFRWFAEEGVDGRARRGRSRRAARRDARLGRRGRRDHECRARPHGLAGDTSRRSRARRRRSSSAATCAVTGATGDALAVDPATSAARRRAAGRGRAAATAGLGSRRRSTWSCAGLGPTRISLRGRHQAENAAVADAVLDALEAAGIATVDAAARRRGYASATWPGRLELLERGGTRGPARRRPQPGRRGGPRARRSTTSGHSSSAAGPTPPPMTLVHGSMADKDVDGIIARARGRRASRGARSSRPRSTGERALAAGELAAALARARGRRRGLAVADVDAHWTEAARERPGPVVVAGSLYLVGRGPAAAGRRPAPARPGAAGMSDVALPPRRGSGRGPSPGASARS